MSPQYWLGLPLFLGAATAIAQATTEDDLFAVAAAHPILLLPSFPATLRALGAIQSDLAASATYRAKADWLERWIIAVRTDQPQPYAGSLDRCGQVLAQDTGGRAEM